MQQCKHAKCKNAKLQLYQFVENTTNYKNANMNKCGKYKYAKLGA